MKERWINLARKEQLAPTDDDWFIWLILAGRGWGKTRTGAEWAAKMARKNPGCRIAFVAATIADARDTMMEGVSGFLNVVADNELRGGSRDKAWNRSLGECYLANGSQIKCYSSEKPGRLRGPAHDFAWADEICAWNDAMLGPQADPAIDTTWSNLVIGLREGKDPKIVATTTPKPVPLIRSRDPETPGIMQQRRTHITTGSTMDNLANLARTYKETVVDPLMGTRLGRQELEAEVLEDALGIFDVESLQYWYTSKNDAGIDCYTIDDKRRGRIQIRPVDCWRFITVDLASSLKSYADWTVMCGWAVAPDGHLILLERSRERIGKSDHFRSLEAMWQRIDGAQYAAVETMKLGHDVVYAAGLAGMPLHELIPFTDKVQRATPAVRKMTDGMIAFPKGADWLGQFIAELEVFPLPGSHDDQVDALAYAVLEIGGSMQLSPVAASPDRSWLGDDFSESDFDLMKLGY